jgi:L-threonylcarbamoyladenylate synthase
MARPLVLSAADPAAVEMAIETILRGGVVGVPTETVYGLAAALDEDGIEALLEAKQRPASKGITLLVDSVEQVETVALVGRSARRLAERFWPGPLTLVLPERPAAALPVSLTGGSGSVGVRIPDHPVPRALARSLGPLPLTSANLSGQPDATTAADVVAALGEAVALVLDDGDARGGVPSTVVVLPEAGPPTFARVGAIPAESIESALR